jgi:hypothetical protein
MSDSFLLNMAEVSATLIGLFLIGILFYVETGFRRLGPAREVFEPYFRAGTRIVLLLYALPLSLSLTLVALGPNWNRVLFALLSLTLVAANVDTAIRVRSVARVTGSNVFLVNEVAGTAAVLTLVSIPWILGGFHPTREDLTWAVLLSFASGFLSVGALVVSLLDTTRFETADQSGAEGQQRKPWRPPAVGARRAWQNDS